MSNKNKPKHAKTRGSYVSGGSRGKHTAHGSHEKKKAHSRGAGALVATLSILIPILIIAVCGVIGLNWHFQDRAAFGAQLAGKDIGGMDKSEIEAEAMAIFNNMTIELKYNGAGKSDGLDAVTAVKPADLGIELDVVGTAARVLDEREKTNPVDRLLPFHKKKIKLSLIIDTDAMQKYLNKKYAKIITPVSEPAVKYDKKSKTFKAGVGKSGQIMRAEDIKKYIDNNYPDYNAFPLAINLKLIDAKPVVSDDSAKETAAWLNERIKSRYQLKSGDKVVHTVGPNDMSSWVKLVSDAETGKYEVSFSKAKIQKFINTTLAKEVNQPSVSKEILVDRNNKQLNLIQEGQDGVEMSDVGKVAEDIYQAVNGGENKTITIETKVEKHKTNSVSALGTNWIDVDLGDQTTTLYNGDTKLRTFIISSGKASTPTVKGTFHVYHKRDVMTMSGGSKEDGTYYSTPNVRWVSFFHAGYAFHGCYWHDNFGHVMSHGCVNMRENEAKIVYDFAPIGTLVIVHD